MQGTNGDPTTATLDFPRPYGVEQAERMRAVSILTLDDPTYAEAREMTWYANSLYEATPFGEMTVAQLIVAAGQAQRLFRAEVIREPMNTDEVRRYWRAMRAATLTLAFRSSQRIGGPFHA